MDYLSRVEASGEMRSIFRTREDRMDEDDVTAACFSAQSGIQHDGSSSKGVRDQTFNIGFRYASWLPERHKMPVQWQLQQLDHLPPPF